MQIAICDDEREVRQMLAETLSAGILSLYGSGEDPISKDLKRQIEKAQKQLRQHQIA